MCKTFFLAVVAVFALSVCCAAGITVADPNQAKARQQLDQNKQWEREAMAREQYLVSQGDRFYTQKEFAKATDCYRQATALTYDQWSVKKVVVGSVESFQPANDGDKYKSRLSTANTRHARDRLASMDTAVGTESQSQLKQKFDKLMADAGAAYKANPPDLVKAYTLLQQIIDLAPQATDKGSKDSVDKAIIRQKEVAALISKPLDEAEKLIADGKAAEAVTKLDDFATTYKVLLKSASPLKSRYDQVINKPEMKLGQRESEVKKKIAMGDASLLREDYIMAARRYREAATLYPDTASARAAAEKLGQMQADPKIVTAMKRQEAEAACRPLLAHAKNMILNDQYDEAKADCQRILDQYPDTPWAIEAGDLMKAIQAQATPSVAPVTTTTAPAAR